MFAARFRFCAYHSCRSCKLFCMNFHFAVCSIVADPDLFLSGFKFLPKFFKYDFFNRYVPKRQLMYSRWYSYGFGPTSGSESDQKIPSILYPDQNLTKRSYRFWFRIRIWPKDSTDSGPGSESDQKIPPILVLDQNLTKRFHRFCIQIRIWPKDLTDSGSGSSTLGVE
jgi:hypothetical protein